VGLQKTEKENISDACLNMLAGNTEFVWSYLPANAAAGGF
jgi:hypothetical protein